MRQLALLVSVLIAVGGCAEEASVDRTVTRLEDPIPGKEAYDKVCASCHEAGLAGAPATGDAAEWTNRSPLWMAVLAEHAEKGYLDMPAKGGDPDLRDAEIQVATDYMLSVTYPERPTDQ